MKPSIRKYQEPFFLASALAVVPLALACSDGATGAGSGSDGSLAEDGGFEASGGSQGLGDADVAVGGGTSTGGVTSSGGGTSTSGTRGDGAPCDAEAMSPGGFCVAGNAIYDEAGARVIFRGVNKPGLEDKLQGEHHFHIDEFKQIAAAGSNVVRLPVNQTWWLDDTDGYRARYESYIQGTLDNGMVAIVDVHRAHDGQGLVYGHADAETHAFWATFAEKYKNEGRLIFELYNEPKDISDEELWLGGGEVAGIHEMYELIRDEVGAKQIILIGGNDWGYDLRGIKTYPLPAGHYNVAFSSHPYSFNGKNTQSEWEKDWAFLKDSYPYILTEFGHAPSDPDNWDYEREIFQYCQDNELGWTAWAWTDYFKNHSMFEKDYNPPSNWGTTTTHGDIVLEYLKK